MRSLDFFDLVRLRCEAALQAAVDAVEIDVDHRRDEQRQQLRHAETADHGDTETMSSRGDVVTLTFDP